MIHMYTTNYNTNQESFYTHLVLHCENFFGIFAGSIPIQKLKVQAEERMTPWKFVEIFFGYFRVTDNVENRCQSLNTVQSENKTSLKHASRPKGANCSLPH